MRPLSSTIDQNFALYVDWTISEPTVAKRVPCLIWPGTGSFIFLNQPLQPEGE